MDDWKDVTYERSARSYAMVTMNANAHPLMRLMHKPERHRETKEILPADERDQRSVVPVAREDWDTWLTGTPTDAMGTLKLPPIEQFLHQAEDPARLVKLPLEL